MSDKPTIFISYSRDDHKAKDFVVSHLKLLEQHSELKFWHDQDMAGGDAWEAEIDRRLNDCVAAIILISKQSLTSQFILRTELKVMLERHHQDGLRIYPIIVENCLWKTYPWLVAMNVRPDRGAPLMRQAPGRRDDIMVEIGQEIADLLLGEDDQHSDGKMATVAKTSSGNGADHQPETEDEPAFALQDWGKPFDFDGPKTTPVEDDESESSDPAPPPPALISIPKAPVWSEDLGIPVPDSFLLQPESRVVPFLASAMGWRYEIFGWAKERERPLKLRLQAGAGGTGKTRLAIDVCETLTKEGWFAGFFPSSFDRDDVERELPTLLDADRDCLFVVDYAETRADVVVTLARKLLIEVEHRVKVAAPRRRFRIVMLAREGGDWFDQLAERATQARDEALKALLTAGATKSGPHRMSVRPIALHERQQIFKSALSAFAKRTGRTTENADEPDLRDSRFERVLMIQMAALAELRSDAVDDAKDLLDNTLGHERRYWRKFLELSDDANNETLETFEQSLALFTLLGGRDSDDAARKVIDRVPMLKDRGPDAQQWIFARLRRFYPNYGDEDDVSVSGVKGLEPDLLGERLVAECARELGDDLLNAALDRDRGANADDARSAFTLLARLASQGERDKPLLRVALKRYFAAWPKEILAVAKETGGPIGDLMADAIEDAEPKTERSIVKAVKGTIAKDTSHLKRFGIEIEERAADAISTGQRSKKMGRGDLVKLYAILSDLAYRHEQSGEPREAADASEKALSVAEHLARSGKVDDQKRLARARNDLSIYLNKIGRFEDTLQQAQKAEELARRLKASMSDQAEWYDLIINTVGYHGSALNNVGHYEPALGKLKEAFELHHQFTEIAKEDQRRRESDLFDDLSIVHLNLGDYEAALEAAERAEEIGRILASENPDDPRHWAKALKSRSQRLGYLGQFESALDDAENAARLYGQLAAQQPDFFARDLSAALNILSLRHRDLSHFDEALEAARKTEAIRRDLATRQPEAYLQVWVIGLANLGEALINTGDAAEAIEVTARAIALLPTLPDRPGDVIRRIAPGFCRRVLAEAQLANGEPGVALDVAEEGAVSLREAFAARPHLVAEHYVQGLATLARCHRALGDDLAATEVLAEGIAGIAPLFKKRPRALQREMLRLIEPLEAIGPEAVGRHVSAEVRAALEKLPELPRGAAGL